jgi:hypothetical protein
MMRPVVLVIAALPLIVGVTTACAGSYEVVACAAAPGGANNSWTSSATRPTYASTVERCPPTETYSGLSAYDNLSAPGNAPAGVGGSWSFAAPAQTRVTRIRYSRYLGKDGDNGWRVLARTAEGAVFDTCEIGASDLKCASGESAPTSAAERIVDGLSTTGLSFGFTCEPILGGSTCSVGVGMHSVWASLYSATVTLSDVSPPSVALDGAATPAGFASATQPLTFTASDNAGIRSARIYVDDSIAASTTYGCDFTYTVPCEDRPNGQLALDTRSLTDGPHRVQVAAVDPAGNETKSASQDVVVDNSAPRAPLDLSVDGGVDWRSANSFDVRWTNADDPGAPVAAAHYQLCAVDGSGCQPPHVQPGDDVSRLTGISVPSQGEWALRLWLEDAAGNTDPDEAAEVSLRYGVPATNTTPAPTAPPAPADRGTAPTLDAPIFVPSLDPTPTPPPSTTTTRLDPRLRLSQPKTSGRRLLIRGVVARSARGRVTLTIRPQHGRLILRSVAIHSGRFSLSLRRTALRSVVVRYAGSTAFRPARATLTLSR